MNDVMQLCAVANGPGGKRRRTETLDELTYDPDSEHKVLNSLVCSVNNDK